MLSLRIVTTSAVLLALAAGSASAQTATTTAAGKPLPLLQIFQKNEEDTATIKPRHRARYAHRRVVRTRVTNHPAGAIHHAFMEVQPEPDAAQPDTTPATTTQAVNATAAPANIWPTPDLTLPGTEGLTPISTTASMTPVPIAGPPLTPAAPATPDNPNEPLAAAYHTVQLAPQVAPLVAPQIAPEVTPTNTAPATPPSPVQVAQADMLSPTDATAAQRTEPCGVATIAREHRG